MTDFYGVNADRILVDNPPEKVGVGELGGRLRVIYDEYTFTAALTTSDTLRLGGKIPKGARIMDCILQFPDLGTTGAFNIGWEVSEVSGEALDANGLGAAVDVATAAGSYSMREDQPQAAGQYKKFTEAVQPVIVPSTNTTATSGTINIAIYYVVE